MKNLWKNNENYFTTIGYITGFFGYLKGSLNSAEVFITAVQQGNAIWVLISIFFWQINAMLSAILAGVIGMLVFGTLLFIPYKLLHNTYNFFREE